MTEKETPDPEPYKGKLDSLDEGKEFIREMFKRQTAWEREKNKKKKTS